MPTVLLSSPPRSAVEELRRALVTAGFTVADHSLGTSPAVDFGPLVAAVIEVADRLETASAQTRRWRVELGDQVLPILWILAEAMPDAAVAGLSAGADVVISRPLDSQLFTAQIRSMARVAATGSRLAVRGTEARLLGDQLQKAYAQLDRELEMSRRVHRTFLPRSFPEVGPARLAVCHRPRSRVGGDFYDARRLDENHLGFILGDVMGQGSSAGSLLSVFVTQTVKLKEIQGNRYRLIAPEDALVGVNRELLGLGLEEPPLVAMVVGVLNVRTGAVTLARGGLPAPLYLPPGGTSPQAWSIPGPFLGTAETTFQPLAGTLEVGGKLLIGSDGTRADGDPAPRAESDRLAAAMLKHRALNGQQFVDAVARELLPHIRHPDDFTMMLVEMVAG